MDEVGSYQVLVDWCAILQNDWPCCLYSGQKQRDSKSVYTDNLATLVDGTRRRKRSDEMYWQTKQLPDRSLVYQLAVCSVSWISRCSKADKPSQDKASWLFLFYRQQVVGLKVQKSIGCQGSHNDNKSTIIYVLATSAIGLLEKTDGFSRGVRSIDSIEIRKGQLHPPAG